MRFEAINAAFSLQPFCYLGETVAVFGSVLINQLYKENTNPYPGLHLLGSYNMLLKFQEVAEELKCRRCDSFNHEIN